MYSLRTDRTLPHVNKQTEYSLLNIQMVIDIVSMCQIFPPFFSKVSDKKVGWRKDFCDGKSDGIGKMAENWRKMDGKK